MSIDRILMLKLVTDVSQTNKAITGTRGRLAGAARDVGNWTKAAGLGVVLAGIDAVGSAVLQGVADFREGEKANDRLARTWQKLGLQGEELGSTIDGISGRAIDLGFDDTESIGVFNKFLDKTHDAKTSTKLLEASWDLARAKGISLADASAIVGKAFDGNKKTLRQFGVEGVTGMEAVNAIMLTSGDAAEEYASTAEGRFERLQGVIGEGFEAAAGIGIQAITDLLPTLDGIASTLQGVWDQVQPVLQDLADQLGPKLGELVTAFGELWDAMAPHIQTALDIIQPLIQSFGTIVGGVMDAITGAIDTIVALLNGDFAGAWQGVQDIIGGIVTAVGGYVDGLLGTLQNILPTIGQAALDIGSAIFTGIVDGVAGLGRAIIDAVTSSIRSGLNALIDVWNDFHIPGMSFRFPGLTLPNPTYGTIFDPLGTPNVNVLGASDFQLWGRVELPDIPRLAAGGIVRARNGGTLALLGEGGSDEAVVPLGSRLGNTYIVNVHAGFAPDPASLGREVVRYIQAFESRGGSSWRTA